MAKRGTLLERFRRYVGPRTKRGCTLWTGSRDSSGYGNIRDEDGRLRIAHRVSHELFIGPIPPGFYVCHQCDVPACVNPEHLVAGTPVRNCMEKYQRDRVRHAKGEQHGCARLSNEQVLAIRADERTQAEIAKDYGVDRSTIGLIRSRKTWTHLA